jgi:hypothetical protein
MPVICVMLFLTFTRSQVFENIIFFTLVLQEMFHYLLSIYFCLHSHNLPSPNVLTISKSMYYRKSVLFQLPLTRNDE